MNSPVIVDALRTPIGRAGKGSLIGVRAEDLAALPIRTLLERYPQLDPAMIDDVIMGAAIGVGEQGYNVARQAALLAGIPETVPATTVNRFCASSLQAIRMAHHSIVAGEGDCFIAAGVEAVSRAPEGPRVSPHPRLDGSAAPLPDVYIPMGLTAENVARERQVSRQAQDEWALRSHQRALAAREAGHWAREIVPVDTGGSEPVVDDDGPRADTSLERLAKLKPAFNENGTVTAGNSCPVNDGAAATLILSQAKADELGLEPRSRILGSAVAGVRPEMMGLGPIPAVRKLLKQAGMKIDDIDLVELNEAFAAQVLPCMEDLGIPEEKLNPFGGALALGHPYGMTGARILTTLMNGLDIHDGTFGIETMCVAGGMGQAILIERLA